MSNLIFIFEAFNPNKRETYFKHKEYTDYIANSKYAIKNKNTSHGLFGYIKGFKNIKELKSIDTVADYVTRLAKNKVPIYRGLISLREYDAMRLGYDKQEKWKDLLDGKLISIASKMNIKYEDLQYVGAVHLEKGHPHLQFFIWSKQRDKMNYFINYSRINKLREEFTNAVFKEDLFPIYQEKDKAKKNIIAENQIINNLQKISKDKKFIQDIVKYENNFGKSKLMKQTFKNEELKRIVNLLIDLKSDLKKTQGSIKYEYLKRYPELIVKLDNISKEVINISFECKVEIESYIKAKQKILEFKYSNKDKLNKEKQHIKEETEREVLKLIGNKILDFERQLLNNNVNYSEYRYINETRSYISNIYNFLCGLSCHEESKYSLVRLKYKKQLSKQAKKELVIRKRNSSSWNWEDR